MNKVAEDPQYEFKNKTATFINAFSKKKTFKDKKRKLL